MIGDWARVNHDGLCIKKGTIVMIGGIDADNSLAKRGLIGSAHCRPLDDDQFEGGIWCEYLEPIPLTAEILEKNGFECRGAWCLPGEDLGLRQDGDSWGLLSYYAEYDALAFCHIKYVHELQHALHLCRIEKEITI